MTPALEATSLGKRYGRRWALRGCTLSLPEGRVIALVGANGAGKSTLLRLAVGLATPSEGSVRVFGRPPLGTTEALAAVGFVAQDAPLYDGFTVADLVELGDRLNPRFDVALARTRIAAAGIDLRTRAGKLSGGQRALVALALAKRPRLLLLDEPVASLDPLARREFLQTLIGAVAEDGITVALSSHLVTDLERVCDYLLVLAAGRVQVLGDMEELVRGHRILTGPVAGLDAARDLHHLVLETRAERQATLLVRAGEDGAALPAGWGASGITLDELVLAYLRSPSSGALPGPAGLTVAA